MRQLSANTWERTRVEISSGESVFWQKLAPAGHAKAIVYASNKQFTELHKSDHQQSRISESEIEILRTDASRNWSQKHVEILILCNERETENAKSDLTAVGAEIFAPPNSNYRERKKLWYAHIPGFWCLQRIFGTNSITTEGVKANVQMARVPTENVKPEYAPNMSAMNISTSWATILEERASHFWTHIM